MTASRSPRRLTLAFATIGALLFVAPTAAQTRLYVLTSGAVSDQCLSGPCAPGRLIQIDVDERRVVADTPILHARTRGTGPRITPDGRYLLWTGSEQPDYRPRRQPLYVSLFDIASRIQTTPFLAPLSTEVAWLSAHPSAMRAFIQLSFGGPITVAEPGGSRTLPLPPCSSPIFQGRSGDGRRLSIFCEPTRSLIVDSQDGELLAAVPHGPTAQTLDDLGTEMFTVDWDFEARLEPTVYRRFEVATGRVLAERVVLPEEFDGLLWLFDHRLRRIYASNFGVIIALDADTLHPVGEIRAPHPETPLPEMVLDPDLPRAYVLWWGPHTSRITITQINPTTLAAEASGSLALDSAVVGMALGPRPPAVSDLASRVDGRAVTLEWQVAPSRSIATGLVIEVGSLPGQINLARLPVAASTTSITVRDVPTGTYHVRVRAVNGSGSGHPSNEIVVSVP